MLLREFSAQGVIEPHAKARRREGREGKLQVPGQIFACFAASRELSAQGVSGPHAKTRRTRRGVAYIDYQNSRSPACFA
ncbi:protein of unknown function [Methanoculleus bourgensis]|uniref:Uncharacterized protein n=1 Tax=Methanoculleus bourgensis TaxID=83986 RepID=A0A0X3BN54_9EURY|nr:protein of unknown function [Methanoculleus bourgensis]